MAFISFLRCFDKLGSRNFKLRIGLDSQVTKCAPPPTKKNVVMKTNDITIYASICITTFSELSKVFFHVILKKKKLNELLNYSSIDISYFCMQIQIEPQEVTAQRLGRKIVHMKNSSKKNTPKTSRRGKIKHLFLLKHQSKTHLNAF